MNKVGLHSRFIILRHETPPEFERDSHWDLMLECDGELLTWAISRLPHIDFQTLAERLPNHRIAYLDYEGPVSGDRGNVKRHECGEFSWIVKSDVFMSVELEGNSLKGTLELRRVSDTKFWNLTFTTP